MYDHPILLAAALILAFIMLVDALILGFFTVVKRSDRAFEKHLENVPNLKDHQK